MTFHKSRLQFGTSNRIYRAIACIKLLSSIRSSHSFWHSKKFRTKWKFIALFVVGCYFFLVSFFPLWWHLVIIFSGRLLKVLSFSPGADQFFRNRIIRGALVLQRMSVICNLISTQAIGPLASFLHRGKRQHDEIQILLSAESYKKLFWFHFSRTIPL